MKQIIFKVQVIEKPFAQRNSRNMNYSARCKCQAVMPPEGPVRKEGRPAENQASSCSPTAASHGDFHHSTRCQALTFALWKLTLLAV